MARVRYGGVRQENSNSPDFSVTFGMAPQEVNGIRERYSAFYGTEPTAEGGITRLEASLGVTLPDDLIAISTFYSGGILGGIAHGAFDPGDNGTRISDETIRLRSTIGLPHRFLVLAEPAESLIVLDSASGEVIWCDNNDAWNLDDTSKMSSSPDRWASYGAFFDFLLIEEAEERADQAERD